MVNQGMLADYTAHNPVALKVLLDKHGVDMRPYKGAFSPRCMPPTESSSNKSTQWSNISELAYLRARNLG